MDADVIVIGAGIAGASLAWHLAPRAKVLLLERETSPGYHTTGRSAAFFAESYGGSAVLPLTQSSRDFFFSSPAGFCDQPLISPRGALHLAQAKDLPILDAMRAAYGAAALVRLNEEETRIRAPMMQPHWQAGSVLDADCQDIDVAALHTGFLKGSKRAGGQLITGAEVQSLQRDGNRWHVRTRAGDFAASIIVNAAGAWADHVARLAGAEPVGLAPLTRTIIVAALADGVTPDPAMPLTLDVAESFYCKPDAGHLWISAADETPSAACDSQPDELTVATIVARFEAASHWRVARVVRAWSGLRSFAPDRVPVFGFDRHVPGFFWCAGQGGFGIQTAPGSGALCADLIAGIGREATARYAPSRFSSHR